MANEPATRPEDSSEGLITETDFRDKTFTERAEFGDKTFTKRPDFSGATFNKGADFSGATFNEGAIFRRATFTEGADFMGATFTNYTLFEGATFTQRAIFRRATFTQGAIFRGATFTEGADFASATFTLAAIFEDTTFTGRADYREAAFNGRVDFTGTTFTKDAIFEGATFTKDAIFRGATFTQVAIFARVNFKSRVVFVSSTMKSETTFDRASFRQFAPLFDGTKLHEGTTWFEVKWPSCSPRTKDDARLNLRAYERLKLEMDRLKKHEDELNFFARELQSRRVLLGFWGGLPIALYGALCDHGRNYIRPLCILLVTVILGAVPIRAHFGGGWSLATFTEHCIGGGAIGLSFANTFGVLGIRKDLIDPGILQSLPGWLKVLATIQTICGIVLLFFFGLSIRNRFRMK